jgi:hypothetical protein
MGGLGGFGGGGAPSCRDSILATDESNYDLTSAFELGVVKVKPSSNLTFDWSAVDADLLGHPFDLARVGMLEVMLWRLSPEEFSYRVDTDGLAQSDLVIPATIFPEAGVTSGQLSELTLMGQPIDPDALASYIDIDKYPPENHVYTAIVAEGHEFGKESRMVAGFQLAADASNTLVKLDSKSSSFQLEVSLQGLVRPRPVVGNAHVNVDWSGLTASATGAHYDADSITRVRAARLPLTVEELEQRFVDLELLADRLYTGEVPAGHTFDLADLEDAGGAAFPGFDKEGTWVVALNCGGCANPAPWYFTVVDPCTNPAP